MRRSQSPRPLNERSQPRVCPEMRQRREEAMNFLAEGRVLGARLRVRGQGLLGHEHTQTHPMPVFVLTWYMFCMVDNSVRTEPTHFSRKTTVLGS